MTPTFLTCPPKKKKQSKNQIQFLLSIHSLEHGQKSQESDPYMQLRTFPSRAQPELLNCRGLHFIILLNFYFDLGTSHSFPSFFFISFLPPPPLYPQLSTVPFRRGEPSQGNQKRMSYQVKQDQVSLPALRLNKPPAQ